MIRTSGGPQELLLALTGGLNTAFPVPNDGQLSEAIGLEYRPPRRGLFACPGRTRYDATTVLGGNLMHGLVFAQFDVSASATSGAPQRLLAFAGTSAFGASATSSTGVFGTLKRDLTSGATTFGDAVHYGNTWFAWNGVDPSWAWFGNQLTASGHHGLMTVTGGLTIQATTTGLTNRAATPGTYQVWITEYVGDGPGSGWTSDYAYFSIPNINSTFAVTSLVEVTLTASTQAIRVDYPAAAKNGANIYWRTYITVPNGKYPFGFVPLFSDDGFIDYPATSLALGGGGGGDGTRRFVPVVSAMGEAFAVTQPLGGVAVAQNDPPPTPWDMTVFQDSLVMIDAADRQRIKYSVPDGPHSWPSTYYVPFETEKQDCLTALEVCNNALLVFSSWYGYRLDDLPRASDGDELLSGRSRAKEPFSNNHGCVSQSGTAVFDIYGSGQLCLFVCRDGIHITDGFKTDYACTDIDWEATVNISLLARSRLVNNPKRSRVEFYYPDVTATSSAPVWRRLDFYYHPTLLQPSRTGGFPRLPILGPTPVPGPVATVGTFGDDFRVWTGSDFGPTAFFEGSAGTQNDAAQLVDSNGTLNKSWKIGPLQPFGYAAESELMNVYTDQADTTASGSYTITATFNLDEESLAYTATSTVDQSLHGAQQHYGIHQRFQNMTLRGAKNDTGPFQEMQYIVLVLDRAAKIKSAKSAY